MQNKKTLALLAIIAGIALVVAYWEQIKAKFTELTGKATAADGAPHVTSDTTTTPGGTSAGSVPIPKNVSYQAILKKGSKGDSVKMLQNLLNAGWKKGLSVDGIFGTKTEAALHAVTGKYSITLTDMVSRFVNPNPLALAAFQALK